LLMRLTRGGTLVFSYHRRFSLRAGLRYKPHSLMNAWSRLLNTGDMFANGGEGMTMAKPESDSVGAVTEYIEDSPAFKPAAALFLVAIALPAMVGTQVTAFAALRTARYDG